MRLPGGRGFSRQERKMRAPAEKTRERAIPMMNVGRPISAHNPASQTSPTTNGSKGLNKVVRRVAIVGARSVGASWAAFYLARGFDVIATDPEPGAEANLRRAIDAAWPALKVLGVSRQGSPEHLSFTPNVAAGVSGADFIQECGPEDQEQKIGLVAEIDRVAPADAIIASSSAALAISAVQSACRHPERCVTGHAMDPPHLMPLVEIAAGEKTSPQAVRRALSLYPPGGPDPVFPGGALPRLPATRLTRPL